MDDLRDETVRDDRSKQAARASEKQKRKEPRRLALNAPSPKRKDNLRNGAHKEDNVREQTDREAHVVSSTHDAVVEHQVDPRDRTGGARHEK